MEFIPRMQKSVLGSKPAVQSAIFAQEPLQVKISELEQRVLNLEKLLEELVTRTPSESPDLISEEVGCADDNSSSNASVQKSRRAKRRN